MLRTIIRDEFTRRGQVTWVEREEAQSLVYVDVGEYSTSGSVTGIDDAHPQIKGPDSYGNQFSAPNPMA